MELLNSSFTPTEIEVDPNHHDPREPD